MFSFKKIKGYDIHYFYDFQCFYAIESPYQKAIGVDIELNQGRCWSNHVTMLSPVDEVNPESANLNNLLKISRNNYTQKYAMNTALLIYSYYGISLPKSELGKMILLSIDSSFKGFFVDRFKSTYLKYVHLLELDELIPVLEKSKLAHFWNVMDEYGLNKKIHIDENGYLFTDILLDSVSEALEIDLELPFNQFTKKRTFKRKSLDLFDLPIKRKSAVGDIISCALVGKNKFYFTIP